MSCNGPTLRCTRTSCGKFRRTRDNRDSALCPRRRLIVRPEDTGRGQSALSRLSLIHSTLDMRTLQRVAVLGAGTMGSRIAAHFASAGVSSVLLDVSTAAASKGVDNAGLITPGNFDDDLGK